MCVCDRVYGYFWAYLLWGIFFSSLWTGFAWYICQLSQHALLFPGYHLQLVQCVCLFKQHIFNPCFLFNKWIYLTKVLQLRLHSWYGTPGCAPIVLCVLTPMTLFFFFCANTHNSSGLICCSFPLASAFPLLPTQDLSLLPLLVVRLQSYFFFTRSLYLYCLSSVALTSPSFTCTQKGHLKLLPLWLRHAGICSHRL